MQDQMCPSDPGHSNSEFLDGMLRLFGKYIATTGQATIYLSTSLRLNAHGHQKYTRSDYISCRYSMILNEIT